MEKDVLFNGGYYISLTFNDLEEEKEFKEMFYDKLSIGFKRTFDTEVKNKLKEEFYKDLEKIDSENIDVGNITKDEFDYFVENLNVFVSLSWDLPF